MPDTVNDKTSKKNLPQREVVATKIVTENFQTVKIFQPTIAVTSQIASGIVTHAMPIKSM